MLDLIIRGGTVVDGTGAIGRTADISIDGGKIVEVGRITAQARREIDADGLHVTPGWIDVHTHYDGQATWDPILNPSFSSGVTTALMGNCGVGFAPVKRGSEQRLIDLMEGVEEIPSSALQEGLRWNWSSFTEYLDVLDAMPRTFDVGALLPHGPLRLWAMGERAYSNKCADGDDLAVMTGALDKAISAGAFGMATSRTYLHHTLAGEMTPDFETEPPELKALAAVVARHGAIFEIAPNGLVGEGLDALKREMALYEKLIVETGVNWHILLFETEAYPEYFPDQLGFLGRMNGHHSRVTGQLAGRCSGALISFLGGHPFLGRPTMDDVQKLPVDQWLRELAKPEVKARLLAEQCKVDEHSKVDFFGEFINKRWDRLYDLGPNFDFEPAPSSSIEMMARKANREPAELAYDLILEHSHHPRIYTAVTNYPSQNLDTVRETLMNPAVVLGLSDAGAHVLSVCDGAIFSFMLTHWTRDRKRGPKLTIEQAVNLMTQKVARSIGLSDRGVLAPGMKADINILDHKALKLGIPSFSNDLPSGAARIMQMVTGYRATIVAGIPTRENDEATGDLPGRLVRYGAASRH